MENSRRPRVPESPRARDERAKVLVDSSISKVDRKDTKQLKIAIVDKYFI